MDRALCLRGVHCALSAFTGTGPIATTSEVECLIHSQTLLPGGVATISLSGSAVQVSLLTGGSSVVVVGTTTLPASVLVGKRTTSTDVLVTETGMCGIIASVGGLGTATLTEGVTSSLPYVISPVGTGLRAFNGTVFTGAASSAKRREESWLVWWGLLLGFGTVV
jgi:hypothetical protein